MKTNKPGTVTQQPLFGCASCYEDFSYPADHLRVYNGECWCEICWDEATHEIADGLDWSKLEPFKPALQVECENLRKDADRYRWLRADALSAYEDDLDEPQLVYARECVEDYQDCIDAAIDAAMQEENK